LAWTLKKWGVSLFVTFHMAALATINAPQCPIRERVVDWVAPYALTTGLWQDWYMFAPDPGKVTIALEALVADNTGKATRFVFPTIGELSVWGKMPAYRHAKYAANMSMPNCKAQREYAARHVVRTLNLPASAYPIKVQLYYRSRAIPPPGTPPSEVPTQSENLVIADFEFPNLQEALP
jgi:hypothetical protein